MFSVPIYFFIKGAIIGFSIAAPVGPIGLLCIRRSLEGGRRSGLVTGLGAATADIFYGFVAAFGLTAISTFLLGITDWLSLVGGCFMLYLGLAIFFSKKPPKDLSCKKTKGLWEDYISTFFLTLTNPMTIIAYVGVLAGLGVMDTQGNLRLASLLVAGVFLGCTLWWLLLSSAVAHFRYRISAKMWRIINWGAGGLIFLFGIYSVVKGLVKLLAPLTSFFEYE